MPTPSNSKAIDQPVRLSVNLSADVAEALRALAAQKGASISEIVRDAIATEAFLVEEQSSGGQILVREKDGSMKQVVLR